MKDAIEVVAPVENVNDETVAIIRWLVENGSFVEEATPIVLAETTKTSFEIDAPASGFLWQLAEAGTDVPVGSVLCYIGDDLARLKEVAARPQQPGAAQMRETIARDEPEKPAPSTAMAPQHFAPVEYDRRTRFSGKATALLNERAIDPAVFEGRSLVREQEVLAYLNGTEHLTPAQRRSPAVEPIGSHSLTAVAPATGVGIRREPLSRHKRYEARRLKASVANTVQSSVTIAVPTAGFFSAAEAQTGVVGWSGAVIIYEIARLLRVYPVFNAFFTNDEYHYYERVHVGYAIDAGNGLKVPVIHDADQKGLGEIADEKQRLLVDYLQDSLTRTSLEGGTFTVTDLSSEGVVHFQPVINAGQSAILGVCAESLAPGSARGSFNLVLAFDHQVADGRTAAALLRDLRDRLEAHEHSLWSASASSASEPQCSRCLRPAGELEAARHFLVHTVSADREKDQAVCTICLQDWYA